MLEEQNSKMLIWIAFFVYSILGANAQCPSITTVSGSAAPTGQICSGDLIFQDEFDSLDLGKWQIENTLSGGNVSICIGNGLLTLNFNCNYFLY